MTLDPSKNTMLVALRSAWRDVGPDEQDKPEYAAVTDEEGMVIRFRPLSAVDQLDRLIADAQGDVQA